MVNKLADHLLKHFNGTAELHTSVYSGQTAKLSYANNLWLFGKIPTDKPFATVIDAETPPEGLLPRQSRLFWRQDNCYMIAARPTEEVLTKGDRIISAICLKFPMHVNSLRINPHASFETTFPCITSRKMFKRTE